MEKAKQNGGWTILEEAEALIIPHDLEDEFQQKPNAKNYFLGLGRSDKRNILQWLVIAIRMKLIQELEFALIAVYSQGNKKNRNYH